MPFLDNAGGYTPVPDKLVREYGFETAYVWGKVWRYCQMANGSCTASHQTIADRAGMSRRTLIDKLDQLIEGGYIEDLTPDLKNKPHTYCTKKGEEKITSTMQNLHSELDESANVAQPKEPTMQNLQPHYAEFAQPTMQNLHLKKDSLETPKETKKKELSPKQKVFLALAELGHIDLKVASPKQQGQLDQAAIALCKTVADIDLFKIKFSTYWTKIDWRGKQGQAPTPAQVREVYGDYCYWLEAGESTPQNDKPKGQYKNGHNQAQNHQARTPAQGDSPRTGTNEDQQGGGLREVSAGLGAALRNAARGGRDPT